MKLICGLGNPGKDYDKTRHNAGFRFLDAFAKVHGFPEFQEKKRALVSEKGSGENKIVLLKPLTFMNLSGEALSAWMRFYNIPPKDICVVYDDVDVPLGTLRFREQGSAGTHNGMKSVIEHLGLEHFPRLRLGIESRGEMAAAEMDLHSFVLNDFSPEEELLFQKMLQEGMPLLTEKMGLQV